MSYTMKLCEWIIEHHLRGVTNVTKKPIWFYAREIDYEADFYKTTYEEI
jgi:hypothetical protein